MQRQMGSKLSLIFRLYTATANLLYLKTATRAHYVTTVEYRASLEKLLTAIEHPIQSLEGGGRRQTEK